MEFIPPEGCGCHIFASIRVVFPNNTNSGMAWVSARDGLYLEPDLESAMDYLKEGKIVNSAGRRQMWLHHTP